MHHMVAFEACTLWWRLLYTQLKLSLQSQWDHMLIMPVWVWLPYVLIAALILYLVMRKWSDPSWRRQRQMKKQVKRAQDEEISDGIVDLLTELQVRGVLSATDVNKRLKQFARGCNLSDLYARHRVRQAMSQAELKAALKAKRNNPERSKENAPVKLPDPRPEEPATKREKISGIFAKFSRKAM